MTGFAADLAAHGDRLALVADGVELTYRQLDARVEAAAAALGGGRRLVLVAATAAVDPLVAYLGALRAGHPVLLADPARAGALAAAYDPDVVCGPGEGAGGSGQGGFGIVERRSGTAHDLHPDLALLLSTSGSTGSPKLVRLSAGAVAANAAAIGEYLGIRDTDRAAATLPLHYCYGLSVVHSNLARGAALLLSDRSVTDPRFWAGFRAHAGTSLHGVPHTFELLDRIGFAELDLPHLRYVTQAGGRLAPDVVRRYAALGEARGWELFVMYGQTEATARMAYLPPRLAARRPTAIGRAIPGGSLSIEGGHGTDGAVGELVYRGPNVMLGYAHGPADLARGRTVTALRTGDLARRGPDGLFEVVGRAARFVKPFGVRVDLDHVERLLADEGATAACTGDDTGLAVAVAGGADPAAARALLARRTGLPPSAIRVVGVRRLPRRDNGKPDYPAVAALAADPPDPAPAGDPGSVRAVFRSAFPLQDLPDGATFTGLGGDSLSYVQVSVGLQRVLGHLPPGWPDLSIAALTGLVARRRWWTTVETPVVLRAVAIVLVVGSHIGLFRVLGGSHVLLAAAGWAFARFALAPRAASPTAAVLRNAARIAVPSALWVLARSLSQDDLDPVNALLVNYVVDPGRWGYWYVETLCQVLLLLALVLAVPGVARCERAHPFGFALAVLAVALVGRLLPDDGNEFTDRMMSPHVVAWIFALGWLAQRAATPGQRLLTAALVAVLVPGSFGEPLRELAVVVGLLLLLVPRLPVPRLALAPLGAVAAGSLAIYLTHYALYPELLGSLPAAVTLVCCLAFGVAVHRGAGAALRAAARLRARPARAPARDARTAARAGSARASPVRG